jgi:hypothetical protein
MALRLHRQAYSRWEGGESYAAAITSVLPRYPLAEVEAADVQWGVPGDAELAAVDTVWADGRVAGPDLRAPREPAGTRRVQIGEAACAAPEPGPPP